MISQILTGLSEHEWREAWANLQPLLPELEKSYPDDFPLTFDYWKSAVVSEGKNRRFISFAITGKRCSLRTGVQEVLKKLLDPQRKAEVA